MSGTLAKIAEIEAEVKGAVGASSRASITSQAVPLSRRTVNSVGALLLPSFHPGAPNSLPLLGFDVAKTGDARIGFVGFPSVGKSTLLSNLAGVYSEVAAYEFTTLTTVPGVIRYKGAKIQCPQSELDAETVKSILAEYKIHNADVTLRSDATADDLIDVVEGNRVYIPCIYVLNKIDQISIEELDIIYKVPHCVPISAHHRWNFDDLLEKIWDYLKLVRM
ncbi:developmentally-regulated GTP-binding protein 1 [Cricetulus griseus]|nr:developmentally-regulated GTP-binding protein 1 [Cricetulus griseus]